MEKLLMERENEVWNFPKFPGLDDSITKYDFVKIYEDHHGSGTLKNATNFSYTTDNEDMWLLPSESYLKVEFYFRKEDGNEYAWVDVPAAAGVNAVNADDINLADNGYNLFKEARYFIADQEIERLDNVGIATLVNHLRTMENYYDFKDSKHCELLFWDDTNKRQAYIRMAKGRMFLMLPVEKIFPFLRHNRHVFRGVRHKITLTLNDMGRIIAHTGGTDGTVYIENMEWLVPYVEPSLGMMAKLETQLSKQNEYTINWSSINVYKHQPPKQTDIRLPLASTVHKPTNIFIMGQSLSREQDQEEDAMKFDNLGIEECYVEVNGVRFPDNPVKADFENYNHTEPFKRFQDACYNKNCPNGYIGFRDNYPIWHIDVSQHKPELYENSSFPNITVYLKMKQAPVTDYIIWIVLYNEREATLNIDSKKMRVIR